MRFRSDALRRAVVALTCALAAGWVHAQGNPANGKTLFESNPIQACTACHGDVTNRRDKIDPGGDVDFDLALARFITAITGGVPQMSAFSAFTTQQRNNIAAYIADVPKARPNPVDFAASGVNAETAVQTITFSNAVTSPQQGVAAAAPLTISTFGITGASSGDFLIKTGGSCANNLVLAAGQSCTVNVSFRTSTSSTKTALLGVTFTQSGGTTTRTAQVTGTVAGQPPPPASSASGGGGALPAAGLGLLLLAAGLRRRR